MLEQPGGGARERLSEQYQGCRHEVGPSHGKSPNYNYKLQLGGPSGLLRLADHLLTILAKTLCKK